MKITQLKIPELVLFEPTIYSDERGYFFESFNVKDFSEVLGYQVNFVQDNESYSKHNVLRGLHYQLTRPQGKLIRVTKGEIFDVAVDLRKHSSTFGQWIGERLSQENKKQLWVPAGFAHGFLVLSEIAQVQYKVTEFRFIEYENTIRFDDPDIGITWPEQIQTNKPILSVKDRLAMGLAQAKQLF